MKLESIGGDEGDEWRWSCGEPIGSHGLREDDTFRNPVEGRWWEEKGRVRRWARHSRHQQKRNVGSHKRAKFGMPRVLSQSNISTVEKRRRSIRTAWLTFFFQLVDRALLQMFNQFNKVRSLMAPFGRLVCRRLASARPSTICLSRQFSSEVGLRRPDDLWTSRGPKASDKEVDSQDIDFNELEAEYVPPIKSVYPKTSREAGIHSFNIDRLKFMLPSNGNKAISPCHPSQDTY